MIDKNSETIKAIHPTQTIDTVDFSRLGGAEEQQRLNEVCQRRGYFALANHGINDELRDRFLAQTAIFFSRPTGEKLKVERTESNPFGFYNKELTKNKLDCKEVFDISLSPETPTSWPQDPDFIQVMNEWHEACHQIAMSLLAAIFSCLDATLAPDFFQPEHTSFLRLNFYPLDPPCEPDPDCEPEHAHEPQFGVSHHTDAGALTLLLQDEVPGLQFFSNGKWLTAPADPNVLLVNLGDMLQVWSNDRFVAPLHRVLASQASVRYSAPYFLNPAYACDCKPLGNVVPRYRTINWRAFRNQRALGDYADFGEEVQISHYRL